LLPARTLLSRRRHWRNRSRLRRLASARTIYNYMRDYDPAVGRYVESDPIGLGGGSNTYAYAHASPSMNIDPHGLLVWSNRESVRPVAPGSYAPIPGEPGVVQDGTSPGFTTADWNIESECVCSGEGEWEFLQLAVACSCRSAGRFRWSRACW
jgi:RHS repeat-associated protein